MRPSLRESEFGLADTSVFISEIHHELDRDSLPVSLGVSVVTIAELRAGVLLSPNGATRARREAVLEAVLELEPIPIDESIAMAWAELRTEIRDLEFTLSGNDAWIAATATTLGVPVVTRTAVFDDLPGVEVIVV